MISREKGLAYRVRVFSSWLEIPVSFTLNQLFHSFQAQERKKKKKKSMGTYELSKEGKRKREEKKGGRRFKENSQVDADADVAAPCNALNCPGNHSLSIGSIGASEYDADNWFV